MRSSHTRHAPPRPVRGIWCSPVVCLLCPGQTPKQIFSQPHPARNAASQGAHTGLLVAAMHGGADVADESHKSPPASAVAAAAASAHARGARILPDSVSSGKTSPGDSTEAAASTDYTALGGAKALAYVKRVTLLQESWVQQSQQRHHSYLPVLLFW